MKVSVAMATYNGGPYLAAQLASLRRQDRLPDELVISDDGSCDETEEVAKEFAATAPFPVIWLRNPGRPGYQRNFDYALSATIGDVILLADQDDVWLSQHVSRLLAPMETNPKLLVVAGDSELMDATGYVPGETVRELKGLTPGRVRATNHARGGAQFRQVLGGRAVVGHSMAVRREVLEVASPLPSTWMYDEWIFLIGAAMGQVRYVDDVVSRYRQYTRLVPGEQEYPRGASSSVFLSAPAAVEFERSSSSRSSAAARVGGGIAELAKWQHLTTRLTYSQQLLTDGDRVLRDLAAKVRLVAFRTSVRKQPTPVRAIRTLPWMLTGRYRRFGRD